MQPNTHLALNPHLCGRPLTLAPDLAVLELATTHEMVADEQGLVHGGFVFGLADAAAMFAVNEPNVVLGAAEVRFLAPVAAGEVLTAHARKQRVEGKKLYVEVEVMRGEEKVFAGSFVCVVPARHVLSARGAQAGGAQ